MRQRKKIIVRLAFLTVNTTIYFSPFYYLGPENRYFLVNNNIFVSAAAAAAADGNAHSFNRPLVIAREGCTLLRVNMFTDLFDEGLLNGIHAFDIDPAKVKLDSPRLLHELREAPSKAQAAATLLSETHLWLTEDVIMACMREAITQYSSSVRFID